jgi:hypothetical protein
VGLAKHKTQARVVGGIAIISQQKYLVHSAKVSNKAPHYFAADAGPALRLVHNNVIDQGAEAAIRQRASIADEVIGLPNAELYRGICDDEGNLGITAIACPTRLSEEGL